MHNSLCLSVVYTPTPCLLCILNAMTGTVGSYRYKTYIAAWPLKLPKMYGTPAIPLVAQGDLLKSDLSTPFKILPIASPARYCRLVTQPLTPSVHGPPPICQCHPLACKLRNIPTCVVSFPSTFRGVLKGETAKLLASPYNVSPNIEWYAW